jgi:hypothetical protein
MRVQEPQPATASGFALLLNAEFGAFRSYMDRHGEKHEDYRRVLKKRVPHPFAAFLANGWEATALNPSVYRAEPNRNKQTSLPSITLESSGSRL